MAERYCFYCGVQLELKQTCNCRRQARIPTDTMSADATKAETSNTRSTSSNTDSKSTAPKFKLIQKIQHFFATLQQRNSKFWQHVWQNKSDSEHSKSQDRQEDKGGYKLLNNIISMLRLLLLEPKSAILFMRNLSLHQIIGYMLMHSSLLALSVSLFVGNTFLGRIIRSYLSSFIEMSISRTWYFELCFVLQIIFFCLLMYAIKVVAVAYVFRNSKQRLPFSEAARILIVGIFYQIVFTGLALCFSVKAPVQFVCFLLMGSCLAFYAEVQGAVTLFNIDSAKAFTKWILVYMIIFLIASLTAPIVLPQFSNYNFV